MLGFSIRVLAILGIATGILSLMSLIYKDHFVKNPIPTKSNWILNLKNHSYDFAVIGSSDVFRDIDIGTIKARCGRSGINLGQDGTCIEENFVLFKKFILNNNKVQTLFIQVYIRDFDSTMRFQINSEQYVPYLNDVEIGGLIKNNTDPVRYFLWKNVPFFAYAEFNSKYPLEDFFKVQADGNFFSALETNCGTETLDKIDHKITRPESFSSLVKTDENLQKLIAFSQKNGIQVALVTLPRTVSSVKAHANRSQLTKAIESLSERNNISYYNFALDTQTNYNNDSLFYDNSHFNKKGAINFSCFFADSLIEKSRGLN